MRTLFLLIGLFLSINMTAQMDDTSYSIGMVMAKNLTSQGITEVDEASFQAGMAAVLAGKETKLTIEEASAKFQEAVTAAKAKLHEGNKSNGEAFLAENLKRKEVKSTASGLQYEVLEVAAPAAKKPTLADKVKVHYHGTLTDGTVFDSSVDRGEPISFPLNGVIQGWQEGLQLMPVGSKYRLYIPYNLAYGERAAGPVIGPFSALIFDVTLLAIE